MSHTRLMIVEDNEEVAQMLVLFLNSRGYKVSVAPDGAAARQLVRESLPNLILMDVGLPDTDGYELLKEFRQSLRTPPPGRPTGRVAREEVAAAKARPDRAIVELRLRHMSDFRDFYGALASADLMRYAALMMNRTLNALGAAGAF